MIHWPHKQTCAFLEQKYQINVLLKTLRPQDIAPELLGSPSVWW